MVRSISAVLWFVPFLIVCRTTSAYDYLNIASAYLSAETAIENFFESYDPTLAMNKVVRFFCATPTTQRFTEVYHGDANMKNKIDFDYPIAFITHGWNDAADAIWMIDVANTWIKLNYTNVCRVGWAIYAGAGYITAATRNVKMVGGYFATFVRALHDTYDVPYKSVTIVGHSLGAHVAGYVGSILNGQIKRIVGMDPAGPLFTAPVIIPTDYRLDSSDAQEVVVIHSCDGLLGVNIPCGHADFYPDGGTFPQPGCVFATYGAYGQIDPISCSHIRAVRIFHNSLLSSNCVGVKCATFSNFFFRQCGSETAILGPQEPITYGKFYFRSDGKAKCTGSY